jgi:hypothetical protein
MFDPAYEKRLIAEYCGDTKLLAKLQQEYLKALKERADSEAGWKSDIGGRNTLHSPPSHVRTAANLCDWTMKR